MNGLLVSLDLRGLPVLVVGGGVVAERKVGALLEAGAVVEVVSPEATARLRSLTDARRISWLARAWRPGDGDRARLHVAATDRAEVNAQIAAEARRRRIPCNCAAPPEAGDVQFLAAIADGPLRIGIGTGGASPLVARRVRELIEAALPPRLGEFIELLGSLRDEARERLDDEAARRAVYERAWASEALELLQSGDEAAARAALAACLEP